MERRFVVEFSMAPGDVFMLTALVRDLKLTYGDRYGINVKVPFPDLWRNNPYLDQDIEPGQPGVELIRILPRDYLEGLQACRSGHRIHFVTWFHRVFEKYTGIRVPCLFPGGDLHLNGEEKENPYVEGRYWIVVPGGKLDWTTKIWSQHRWQQVVDELRRRGFRIVQEGATKKWCVHPPLQGVLNLVGKTTIRDLIRNIYHADGVICGITLQMHLAAALQKPCVVIAGGYESVHWEAYTDAYGAFGEQCSPVKVPHRFLHAIGKLPCCEQEGCWRRRVVPVYTGLPFEAKYNSLICERRVTDEAGQIIPECLSFATTEDVVKAVLQYYDEGVLPPLGGNRLCTPCTIGQLPEPPRLVRPTEMEFSGKVTDGSAAANMSLPPAHFAEKSQPAAPIANDPFALFDHPAIGGKITISVVCYGDYHDLHKRCLLSIASSIPQKRRELRIACNQVCRETLEFLKTIPDALIYPDENERKKYAAVRAMYHDPRHPLSTRWVVHFDDDSYVRVPLGWLRLAEQIIFDCDDPQIGGYGLRMYHILRPRAPGHDPKRWFREATWFRGLPFQNRAGQPDPNGDCVHFLHGAWLVLRTDAILRCDIPDPRLNHNGGDIAYGAALYQNGYRLRPFNDRREWFAVSESARRGYSEKFPWWLE